MKTVTCNWKFQKKTVRGPLRLFHHKRHFMTCLCLTAASKWLTEQKRWSKKLLFFREGINASHNLHLHWICRERHYALWSCCYKRVTLVWISSGGGTVARCHFTAKRFTCLSLCFPVFPAAAPVSSHSPEICSSGWRKALNCLNVWKVMCMHSPCDRLAGVSLGS